MSRLIKIILYNSSNDSVTWELVSYLIGLGRIYQESLLEVSTPTFHECLAEFVSVFFRVLVAGRSYDML